MFHWLKLIGQSLSVRAVADIGAAFFIVYHCQLETNILPTGLCSGWENFNSPIRNYISEPIHLGYKTMRKQLQIDVALKLN